MGLFFGVSFCMYLPSSLAILFRPSSSFFPKSVFLLDKEGSSLFKKTKRCLRASEATRHTGMLRSILCSAACLYLCLCKKKNKALPFCFRDFVRIRRGVHARYLLASLVSAQSPHLAPTGAVAKRAQSPSCALVALCAICVQPLNVALLEISNLVSKIMIFPGRNAYRPFFLLGCC